MAAIKTSSQESNQAVAHSIVTRGSSYTLSEHCINTSQAFFCNWYKKSCESPAQQGDSSESYSEIEGYFVLDIKGHPEHCLF